MKYIQWFWVNLACLVLSWTVITIYLYGKLVLVQGNLPATLVYLALFMAGIASLVYMCQVRWLKDWEILLNIWVTGGFAALLISLGINIVAYAGIPMDPLMNYLNILSTHLFVFAIPTSICFYFMLLSGANHARKS
jgi:hypothetical protein